MITSTPRAKWLFTLCAVMATIGVATFVILRSPAPTPQTPPREAASAPAPRASDSRLASAQAPAAPAVSARVLSASSPPPASAVAAANLAASATAPAPGAQPLKASAGGTLQNAVMPRAAGTAKVKVGGKVFALEGKNHHYPRLAVSAAQPVPIDVAWPGDAAPPHSDVLVSAIHGGSIDGEEHPKRFPLVADNQRVHFTFQAPAGSTGHFQVVLRRGAEEEALEFWVPTKEPQYDPPALR